MTANQQNHPEFRQELHKVGHYAKDTLSGFKTFILRGNVVDLAIGIVIGAAFTSVVQAMVKDIITPLIPTGTKGNSLANWSPTIGHTYITLHIGDFINAVISFLIVAFILYFFVVRPVGALLAYYKPKEVEAPPTTHECPYCLQDIPLLATRCAYCTSPVAPIGGETEITPVNRPEQVPPQSAQ